jgi:DNA-binding MarR family transcriptional regulator
MRHADSGGLRPIELECRLLLAQHSVSRLVDRMVAKSVTRKREAAGDGRGHLVELTQEGQADA